MGEIGLVTPTPEPKMIAILPADILALSSS